jgi:hypothetical protein
MEKKPENNGASTTSNQELLKHHPPSTEKKTENNGASTTSNQKISELELARLKTESYNRLIASLEPKITENNGASTTSNQKLSDQPLGKKRKALESSTTLQAEAQTQTESQTQTKPHRYVISAHGWYPVVNGYHRPQIERIGYNCAVYFYCNSGEEFSCNNVFQTSLCQDFKFHGKVERHQAVYRMGKTDFNYLFRDDEKRNFKAGIVDCADKEVIFDLKHRGPQNLRTLLNIIDTNNTLHHSGRFYEVHILACRSFVDYKFKQKYLKYKQKYLALKNQHIKTQVNYSIQ